MHIQLKTEKRFGKHRLSKTHTHKQYSHRRRCFNKMSR